MGDLDENGLAMAEERMGMLVDVGVKAARSRVAVDPTLSSAERDCRECGDPIPAGRILAAPWTLRCFDCQSGVERR